MADIIYPPGVVLEPGRRRSEELDKLRCERLVAAEAAGVLAVSRGD